MHASQFLSGGTLKRPRSIAGCELSDPGGEDADAGGLLPKIKSLQERPLCAIFPIAPRFHQTTRYADFHLIGYDLGFSDNPPPILFALCNCGSPNSNERMWFDAEIVLMQRWIVLGGFAYGALQFQFTVACNTFYRLCDNLSVTPHATVHIRRKMESMC